MELRDLEQARTAVPTPERAHVVDLRADLARLLEQVAKVREKIKAEEIDLFDIAAFLGVTRQSLFLWMKKGIGPKTYRWDYGGESNRMNHKHIVYYDDFLRWFGIVVEEFDSPEHHYIGKSSKARYDHWLNLLCELRNEEHTCLNTMNARERLFYISGLF